VTTANKIRLPPRPPRFLAVLTVTMLASLGLAVVAPVLGPAAERYELSESAAALLLASFAAGRLAFTAPAGFLADRFRFGAIAGFAMAAITASAAVSSLLPPFAILLGAQVIQGAGSALLTTSSTTWVLGASNPAHAGRILTLFQSLIVTVYSFSPLIGGVAGDIMGVRGPFAVSAVAGGIGLVLTLVWLRDVGATSQDHAPEAASEGAGQAPSRRRLLGWSVVAAAIIGFTARLLVTGLQNTMFPLFAADQLEMSPSMIGALLTLNGLAMLVALPLDGHYMDQAGRRPTVRIGLALAVVSAIGFAGIAGIWTAAVVLIFSGFARAILTPTPMVIASDTAAPGTRGKLLGFVRSGIELGSMTGPLTAGVLLEAFDYVGGSLIFGGLLAALAAVVWRIPETRKPTAPDPTPGPKPGA
jgi:MFS family permease